jgi:hypothetical protein
MSKFWSHVTNALSALFVAVFIMIQIDVDGVPLTDGWEGLHIAMIAAFAIVVFNLFRAMQVVVYGEEF